ncbi:hypothetical protein QWJ90_06350 [Microbacterium oryzae]|uniref:hypothetical protein n=1 Tax=Microbacterium oryzae TaxID=743009 RepID=UPI0025B1DF09|nr:hypothetical protein [Microbacterium oryzae]MDN3310545.1 hypothetical protein [Microbacterium oryzae]
MAFTVNIVCRASGHDHDARLLSRFTDRVNGAWKPLPSYKPTLGEEFALIWEDSEEHADGEIHLRYKFPCGAEVTQERLHSLLDAARAKGESEITLG